MALGVQLGQDTAVQVLGIRFHTLDLRQVVEQLLYWIDERSRRMLITAGPEFVMKTREDKELRQIAHVADMVTPDGIGVVWAANRRKKVVQGRVTGVELIPELLATVEQRHQPLRVYILGATEASLNTCLARFEKEYPLCEFKGHSGYFTESELPAILAEIETFAPHLWLVGLGQPRQEKLIYSSLASLPPCVAIGIGGSVDAWSGTVKRAPTIFRRLNVEWMYRLLKQPSRWRRQLALPRFVWHVLRNADRDD